MILTNELPRLGDASGAPAGRLILLRFQRSWYGHEDPGLTGRLLMELPGILLWAIAGWDRLRGRGRFLQPDSGRSMVRDLKDLTSPVGAFVRECCHVRRGFKVEVPTLFSHWKVWCADKGRREPGTEQTFGRDLRAALPAIDDRQRRRFPAGKGGRCEPLTPRPATDATKS